MIRLIEQFNGNDRWYLEALGAAMQESPHEYYPVIMSILGNAHKGEPCYQALVSLLWRLHPVEALPFFPE